MTAERIRQLPKVELHCHLDGSVPLCAFEEMGRRRPGSVPKDKAALLAAVQADERCADLGAYLRHFGLALALLKDPDNLELATLALAKELAAEHIVYAELRFAPAALEGPKMDAAAAVECVTAALRRAGHNTGLRLQAILCMMRHHSEAQNRAVLALARRYLGSGVCGVDLAGDEGSYPQSLYAGLFRAAAGDGLPYTVHAGESGSAQNVREAVAMGAARIGHGIAAAGSAALMMQLAENGVLLEMCPTSNLQTNAVQSWAQYPFASFLDAGCKVCVNTDNRTVSATGLTREWGELAKHYDFVDEALLRRLTLYALQGAFIGPVERQALQNRVEAADVSV